MRSTMSASSMSAMMRIVAPQLGRSSGSTSYRPATREAIRAFQHEHGLVTDGIAGPATLAALDLGTTNDPVAMSAAVNT